VFFDRFGQPLGERGGFDAVIGNPPYVRQEQLALIKPYLAQVYPETYHGVADLYVYFYQQGLRLLRQGGRMSYIVTNKWMRAGYGEPLRAFFAEQSAIEQIIDFGHAPIFEDADVFPCIIVLTKPATPTLPSVEQEGLENEGEGIVLVTSFPREALKLVQLDGYVQKYGHPVPQRRFTAAPWSLEASAEDKLMLKFRDIGEPLVAYAGVRPLAGVKTGLNKAFLIDTQTKQRLIREDDRSQEIIKPYLRGRDIKRWSPDWSDLWMIFTRRGINTYPAIQRYIEQFREDLEPRPNDWDISKTWNGRKAGSYKWYEIQDPVDYHLIFNRGNILYQDLAFHSRFGIGQPGLVPEMTCFCLPSTDTWLLTVLNSPLMWSYMWRNVVHGKDEVLRLKTIYGTFTHRSTHRRHPRRGRASS